MYTTKYLSIAPLNPFETYIFMEVSDQKQIRFCSEDHTLLDFQVFPNTAETCAIVSRRRMTNENRRCHAQTHRGTCPLRVPLWPDESVVCSNCSKVRVSGPLVQGVFSWWLSRWRGPHWRSVSGAHLCVLDSTDGQGCRGCRGCLQVLILHLWQILVKSV